MGKETKCQVGISIPDERDVDHLSISERAGTIDHHLHTCRFRKVLGVNRNCALDR